MLGLNHTLNISSKGEITVSVYGRFDIMSDDTVKEYLKDMNIKEGFVRSVSGDYITRTYKVIN